MAAESRAARLDRMAIGTYSYHEFVPTLVACAIDVATAVSVMRTKTRFCETTCPKILPRSRRGEVGPAAVAALRGARGRPKSAMIAQLTTLRKTVS